MIWTPIPRIKRRIVLVPDLFEPCPRRSSLQLIPLLRSYSAVYFMLCNWESMNASVVGLSSMSERIFNASSSRDLIMSHLMYIN